eukprot:COSAG05_NODE_5532_length_1149_cov_31.949519_2_plen_83_part_01
MGDSRSRNSGSGPPDRSSGTKDGSGGLLLPEHLRGTPTRASSRLSNSAGKPWTAGMMNIPRGHSTSGQPEPACLLRYHRLCLC